LFLEKNFESKIPDLEDSMTSLWKMFWESNRGGREL
jgi:hypothetical protein